MESDDNKQAPAGSSVPVPGSSASGGSSSTPNSGDSVVAPSPTDIRRRRALLGISSVLGGAGSIAAAAPFFASLRPSRKTQAEGAPVTIRLDDIEEGVLRVAVWRQKPVWVLRRTPEMIASLKDSAGLSDPDSDQSSQPENCKNETRSIKPEYFVAVGLCTHLGCSPRDEGEGKGFLCACHGSRFDFAGRVYSGSPAPLNLFIPPYYFNDKNEVVIGAGSPAA